MEAVYLLFSIASTFIKSTVLSLLLALKSIINLRPSSSSSSSSVNSNSPHIFLYEGNVRHVRRSPVAHSFEYPVRYALFDLDRAPQRSEHLTADDARRVASTNGPVFLLTIPASVGYEQNPLSVYYCYDIVVDEHREEEEIKELKTCIAEVTNTPWGERVMFGFTAGSDLVAKPLHVSPFMDMLGNWTIHADAPGEDLFLAISVQHPTLGNYFTATLCAKRVHSSLSSLDVAWYFWLMPHKVAVWIYFQAVKLWWKNVSFLDHPKYANPQYRDLSLELGQSDAGVSKDVISLSLFRASIFQLLPGLPPPCNINAIVGDLCQLSTEIEESDICIFCTFLNLGADVWPPFDVNAQLYSSLKSGGVHVSICLVSFPCDL